MKTITLYNQIIQFDADGNGSDMDQACLVLEKISNLLSTADISGAQILCAGFDSGDIVSTDCDEEG